MTQTAAIFANGRLKLLPDAIIDPLGTVTADMLARDLVTELPWTVPKLVATAPPIVHALWDQAWRDVAVNQDQVAGETFLWAGTKFRGTIFGRDVAYAGLLGLDRLIPSAIRASLLVSRRNMRTIGRQVESSWPELMPSYPLLDTGLDARSFRGRFRNGSFMSNTDDVYWLWAWWHVSGPEATTDDLRYLVDEGAWCFDELYAMCFDAADGLYRGQATFVDIPQPGGWKSGYPQTFTPVDCVCAKATGTNALYQLAMQVLADAHTRLGEVDAAAAWRDRATAHRQAMRAHLRRPDGSWSYLQRPDGCLEERSDALGTALAWFAGLIEAEEAAAVFAAYPLRDHGVPLLAPPFPHPADRWYQSDAVWPWVDAFFLEAKQQATGEDTAAFQLAAIGRTTYEDGTFREIVHGHEAFVNGSASQLWSAAGFINACLRAGWVGDSIAAPRRLRPV